MSRTDIEDLVTSCFSRCPFCGTEGSSLRFEWGHSIPKSLSCSSCQAKWELLFGLDKDWKFLGAKLVHGGSHRKGTELLGRLYDRSFWEKQVPQAAIRDTPTIERSKPPNQAEKTIIIREIVKIRCPYCGGLYNEVKNRCPYCSGPR